MEAGRFEEDEDAMDIDEPAVVTSAPNERTIDGNTPFRAIVDLYEKCVKAKPKRRRELLQLVFTMYRRKSGETDMFSLMRLLLPQLDKERQSYGLKETSLAKFYVNALGIAATSEDAQRMINWRKPASTRDGEYDGGDFGQAVFLSLERRCGSGGKITISNLNDYLDKLNSHTEKEDRIRILGDLLKLTSASEQKWIVRIILKELKIGISEKFILAAFHPEAVNLHGVCNNLRQVCEKLKDPKVSLDSDNLVLFNPIKPMLANRVLPEKIPETMEHSEFVIEKKFDGERIQVHRHGNTLRYYSRNANEVTQQYGPMLNEYLLKTLKADKCILDGELLMWDSIGQKFEEFGSLRYFHRNEAQKADEDAGDRIGKHPCYIIFDVLMVNGTSIIDLALKERQIVLKRCIPQPIEKRVELCESKQANSVQEILDALETAIENGDEGVMIKRLDSKYRPDERKNNWVKLKPEYVEGVGDELDLVVLGGYYGAGQRRGGNVSHFLLGVKTDTPNVYWSTARVGSGYSDNDLRNLLQSLSRHWRPFKDTPPFFELANNAKNRPDVYLDPQQYLSLDSFVKAAQIVPSDVYRTGMTLRFPRVTKIRTDKSAPDATSLEEALELKNIARLFAGRLNRQGRTGGNEDEGASKRAKRASTKKVAPSIETRFTPANGLNQVVVIQDIFGGLEFCVLNGDKDHPKRDLERMIHELKGNAVQNPTKTTFCCIAATESVKVSNLRSHGEHDIVKAKWLLDIHHQKALIPLEPRYMWFSKPETLERFANDLDPFGDSYTSATSADHLREIFESMDDELREKRREALAQVNSQLSQLSRDSDRSRPNNSLNFSLNNESPKNANGKRPRPTQEDYPSQTFTQNSQTLRPSTPHLSLNPDDSALDTVLPAEIRESLIPYKRRALASVDAFKDLLGEDTIVDAEDGEAIKLAFEKHLHIEGRYFGIFRGLRIHLSRYDQDENAPLNVTALGTLSKIITFFGGVIDDGISRHTDVVVVIVPPKEADQRRNSRVPELMVETSMLKQRFKVHIPIVSSEWVLQSVKDGLCLSPDVVDYDVTQQFNPDKILRDLDEDLMELSQDSREEVSEELY